MFLKYFLKVSAKYFLKNYHIEIDYWKESKYFSLLAHFLVNDVQFSFFKLGFTLCKTEQPLQGMELKEKEVYKD